MTASREHKTSDQPAPRHIVVGISDPSDDPSRHRVFQIAALYDATSGGWRAAIAEENANAQPSPWRQGATAPHQPPAAPTAAACLGQAVEFILSVIMGEAARTPPDTGH